MATKKVIGRTRRHARVRKRVAGTAERPRLAVFRSNRHIYAQLIDDRSGRTLVAASTLDAEAAAAGAKGNSGNGSNGSNGNGSGDKAVKSDAAKSVGMLVGKRAKESGIEAAVFDRGGYQFHGRVRQVAEGAREAGLKL
jgi:large subunit ribosomal protein L18